MTVAAPILAPAPPATGGLWRHQAEALDFCLNRPASLLHVGMGAGKTRVALERILRRGHRRTLVVCPLSVVPAWVRQAELHTPDLLAVPLGRGSVAQKRAAAERALTSRRQVVCVINYESVWREPFGEWAMRAGFDLVIPDEAHRLKAAGSQVSRYFARLRQFVPERLALSGTPLAHSPLDAYGLFRFLDPSIFGTSFVRFRARYAVMGGYENRQVVAWINQGDFQRRFSSITYHADRSVLDLPAVQHLERTFELPPEARRAYRELRDEFVTELDAGIVTVSNALSKLLRLQQVTSGYLPLEDGVARLHSGKEGLLVELFDELEPREPVVVFCRFIEDLAAVHRAAEAAGRTCSELSGRRRELEEWQEGRSDVLAVQINAGSEGIDLTRACYAVYYSNSFSLATYEQSLARVSRPGQTRPVTYVHLICDGTVDRKVYAALRQRREVIDSILMERSVE